MSRLAEPTVCIHAAFFVATDNRKMETGGNRRYTGENTAVSHWRDVKIFSAETDMRKIWVDGKAQP